MKTISSQNNLFCLPWAQAILGTHLYGTIRPFVLNMADNRFWAPGACISNAWNAGRNLRKKSK
ncbi:MAG: hypothetical protein AMK70_07195 [Nitrospira bacterium SG8_35_1]|nr:MAG: hypothetical protein AMK70_07195 [Nitrospira bacterium SG8_35_1]